MPRVKIQKGHELITIVVRANVANCMIDMASARATIKQTMIAMRWRCICLSWCMCVYVCVCMFGSVSYWYMSMVVHVYQCIHKSSFSGVSFCCAMSMSLHVYRHVILCVCMCMYVYACL